MLVKNAKSFLIEWNNTFVLDKSFRTRNNIRFNSKEHRETCQIDIYLDYLEEKIFDDSYKSNIENNKKLESYNKGIWMEEKKIDNAELTEIFDNIDIDSIED